MTQAIILNANGFRVGTAAVMRYGPSLYIGDAMCLLRPTAERTLPEGYVVCDVLDPATVAVGYAWQAAVSDTALSNYAEFCAEE